MDNQQLTAAEEQYLVSNVLFVCLCMRITSAFMCMQVYVVSVCRSVRLSICLFIISVCTCMYISVDSAYTRCICGVYMYVCVYSVRCKHHFILGRE